MRTAIEAAAEMSDVLLAAKCTGRRTLYISPPACEEECTQLLGWLNAIPIPPISDTEQSNLSMCMLQLQQLESTGVLTPFRHTSNGLCWKWQPSTAVCEHNGWRPDSTQIVNQLGFIVSAHHEHAWLAGNPTAERASSNEWTAVQPLATVHDEIQLGAAWAGVSMQDRAVWWHSCACNGLSPSELTTWFIRLRGPQHPGCFSTLQQMRSMSGPVHPAANAGSLRFSQWGQIDKDVKRLLLDHVLVAAGEERWGMKQLRFRVRQLLRCWCAHSPVGYLQGMHEVAAHLLLVLDEPEAFGVFVHFYENCFGGLLLPKTVQPGFLILRQFMERLFEEIFPRLLEHLASIGDAGCSALDMFYDTFCVPAVIRLFGGAPILTQFRVWDTILTVGPYTLVSSVLAAVAMHEMVLLSADTFATVNTTLRHCMEELYDVDPLMELSRAICM